MDPSYIAVWLRKPVPALDDDKPLEVIARGDYRQVAKLVCARAMIRTGGWCSAG
jgi:hypothetical protein